MRRYRKIWNFFKTLLSKNGATWRLTLHKKLNFPLRISSVNVTKSTGKCGFGHIYWRNLEPCKTFKEHFRRYRFSQNVWQTLDVWQGAEFAFVFTLLLENRCFLQTFLQTGSSEKFKNFSEHTYGRVQF